MAIIGGYGTGSSISSLAYDNFVELLNGLPDNKSNLIKGSNIRDAVLSLWDHVDLSVASISTTYSYTNANPSTITVGGIPKGTTFNSYTFNNLMDNLFYPYIQPTITLNTDLLEYKNTYTITSKKYLTLNISNTSNTITSYSYTYILNDGTTTKTIKTTFNDVIAPNTTKTRSFNITSTSDINNTSSKTDDEIMILQDTAQLITFTFNDNKGNVITKNITIKWYYSSYYGLISAIPSDTTTLLNNFTTYPSWGNACDLSYTDGRIFPFTSSTTSYDNINAYGNYLLFAFPISSTPIFTINGLISTDFTKLINGDVFRYSNGTQATDKYYVYVLNNKQHSPIDSFKIKF